MKCRTQRRLQLETCESRRLLSTEPLTFVPYELELDAPITMARFADIDNDGDGDLLAVSNDGLRWFENQDRIGKSLRVHAIQENVPIGIETADLDGDDDLDLLIHEGESVVWLENVDGKGRFDRRVAISTETSLGGSLVTADLDGDEDFDLVLTSSGNRFFTFENTDGLGTFRLQASHQAWGTSEPTISVGDLDDDGDPDIVSATSRGLFWHENIDGHLSNISAAKHFIQSRSAAHPVIADFDRDGDSDVMVSIVDEANREIGIRWYENSDGLGRFIEREDIVNLDGRVDVLTQFSAEDVDRDGDLDVLATRLSETPDSGGSVVWYENVRGDFGDAKTFVDFQAFFAAGDLDADGDLDLLLAREMTRPKLLVARVIGDSNDDGVFDSTDMIRVFQAAEYEDQVHANSTFDEGDWNLDGEFDSADLIFAFQSGQYNPVVYPRLFFGPEDLPDIRAKFAGRYAARFLGEKRHVLTLLGNDYSDPELWEHTKAIHAQRISFVVLMLDRDDPDRIRLADKAREIMTHINDGIWHPTTYLPVHHVAWDGTVDIQPWTGGGSLADYSYAYDFLVGAGELTGIDRADARFRILRLAQIEHSIQKTPAHLLHAKEITYRKANKQFRSVGGVGIVALTFPDQKGIIEDPFDRVPAEFVTPFDTEEALTWVMSELFVDITVEVPGNETTQGMIHHYVSPDGFYGEGFTYQNDAFGVISPFLVAYDRITGLDYISGNGPFDGRIAKMYTNNLRVMTPEFDRPSIGDSWKGTWYYWRDLIAPYTDDPDANYWLTDQRKNLTLSLGVSIASFRADSERITEPNYRTEFLPEAGIAVFRDEWGPNGTYLMLLAQDRPVYGHDQADQGSILLYSKGAYLVLDPGYGRAYALEPGQKSSEGGKWNWLISGLGHSGVTVDSLYTVDTTPTAQLLDVVHPRISVKKYEGTTDPARLENMLASRHIDYADAIVEYDVKEARLARGVAFPRHRYFILDDRITANAEHEYGWQLQLGDAETGRLDSSGRLNETGHATDTGERYTWSIPNSDGDQVELEILMLDDNRSVDIYHNGPTNFAGTRYPEDVYDRTYILASETGKDTRYTTILDPHLGTEEALNVETIVDEHLWKVWHSPTSYDLILSQDSSSYVEFGEIATDATFVVVSIDEVGGVQRLQSVLSKGGNSLSVGYDQDRVFQTDSESLFHLEAPE